MPLPTDTAVDRRRLKKSLTLWRAIGIVALAATAIFAFEGVDVVRAWTSGNYVGRLSVEGIVFQDRAREEALAAFAKDPRAKALVVEIDSPGGTVVGGESLFLALREVASRKPVVAVVGEMAASGGYMVALGADRIFARGGSITGSIGVILQTVDATELLSKLGVKPESVKSSPLKAQPNPLEPFTEDARRATEEIVADSYRMFFDMVADRRGLTPDATRVLADGRIFTGRQAAANGLIDALGGEDEARAWLSEAHGVPLSLPSRDVAIRRKDDLLSGLIGGMVGKTLFSERLRLDGLISLWHPDTRQ